MWNDIKFWLSKEIAELIVGITWITLIFIGFLIFYLVTGKDNGHHPHS